MQSYALENVPVRASGDVSALGGVFLFIEAQEVFILFYFIYLFIYLFIYVFLPFLEPLLQHMEVLRLGV